MVNSSLKPIILGFVFIVLAGVFIQSIANTTTDVTEIKTASNESITLVNGTPVSLANNQLVAVQRVANGSGAFDSGNFTTNLPQGQITWTAGNPAGTFQTTYTFRQVGDGTARSLTTIIVLLFALGIFISFLAIQNEGFREAFGSFLRR